MFHKTNPITSYSPSNSAQKDVPIGKNGRASEITVLVGGIIAGLAFIGLGAFLCIYFSSPPGYFLGVVSIGVGLSTIVGTSLSLPEK